MDLEYKAIKEEEEKVNTLLSNITLEKPSNIFHIFVKEEIRKEKEKGILNKIDSNKIPEEDVNINIIDFNKYKIKWNSLDFAQKNEYKKLYSEEYKKYLKNIEIVKKYLFKGIDGKINLKQTSFHLFLNEQLINGLEKGEDPKKLKKQSKQIWKNMPIYEKEKFYKQKKNNDTLITLILKYKQINPIIIFSYIELENSKKSNILMPELVDILKKWNNLPSNKKKIYESYTNELIFIRFKLLNIFYIINGVKPKIPAGALRLFLQIKVKENSISSVKEGIEKWNILDENEKDKFLKLSHNYYLSYKYQELLYNKKINKFLPKKPNLFNLYLKDKKGVKIDKGNNTINYWRQKFDSLKGEEKAKYEKKYKVSLEVYNKKIENFKNKIFDFPIPPKNPFIIYFNHRISESNNNDINIKNKLELIAKEWNAKNYIDKEKYIKLSNIDKKRYKDEIIEFEKFGYYMNKKENDTNKEKPKRNIQKKRSNIIAHKKAGKRNISKNRNKKYNYGSPVPKKKATSFE